MSSTLGWQQVLAECQNKNQNLSGGASAGFGLTQQIYTGLTTEAGSPPGNLLSQDVTVLSNAFMLNDEGNVDIDPSAGGAYTTCLHDVNTLLTQGVSSQACSAYVATDSTGNITSGSLTSPDGKSSSNGSSNDGNYTILFEPCPAGGSNLLGDLCGNMVNGKPQPGGANGTC